MAYIMHENDTDRMWANHLSGLLWEGVLILEI